MTEYVHFFENLEKTGKALCGLREHSTFVRLCTLFDWSSISNSASINDPQCFLRKKKPNVCGLYEDNLCIY